MKTIMLLIFFFYKNVIFIKLIQVGIDVPTQS